MGASADCESIGIGLLGQPANSLTTIGFLLAGVFIIVKRPGTRWIGGGLIATGVGSFLFHGPMPPGNEWAHDLALAWLLALVAGTGSRWEGLSRIPALLAMGVLFAVAPAAADPVAVGLTVVALVSLLNMDRSAGTLGPLALLAAAAVFGRLGATGGPLCDPDSLFQPHAVWHLGAALAVGWWALSRTSASTARI
ncbi:MAG: hypothetical protein ACRDZM_17580 [Acidimicrobiia bacterium]